LGSLPTVAERSLINFFEEAHALPAHYEISAAQLNRATVTELHHRLRALPNEYQKQKLGAVRTVHDRNLLMVEQGLTIDLLHPHLPSHGYKLAETYREHYDTPYGPGLSGPSRIRLGEIVQSVRHVETQEHERDTRSDCL
jgi:hypothetical protein